MLSTRQIFIILGPTASGKSATAMKMASDLGNAVIVNSDATQVFNFCPILSNQPSDNDKISVQHLLYGFLDINERFSVGKWMILLEKLLSEYSGYNIIITGGTCMYLYTLLHGLSIIPDIDVIIEKDAMVKYDDNPIAFQQCIMDIDPNNVYTDKQRLVRSYCLYQQTGRTLTYWQMCKKKRIIDSQNVQIIKLLPERHELYTKCNNRFIHIINNGVIEEIKHCMELYGQSFETNKVIGYNEIRSYILGDVSIDTCIEIATKKIRHYAKNQITWIKNKF